MQDPSNKIEWQDPNQGIDDMLAKNPNVVTTGISTGYSSVSSGKSDSLQPNVIANGKDLIVKDVSAGTENLYHIFRDFNISDMKIHMAQDNFPSIDLTGRSYDGVESRTINIPNHIPKEQRARYITSVFDKGGVLND